MKYYYTDPLAAAWMGKHFGMRFDTEIEPYLYLHGEDNVPYYIHPDSLQILEPEVGDLIGANRLKPSDFKIEEAKLYSKILMHDCARLPEYKYSGGFIIPPGYFYQELIETEERADWIFEDGFENYMDCYKIIQRNGIAFMWPEGEE